MITAGSIRGYRLGVAASSGGAINFLQKPPSDIVMGAPLLPLKALLRCHVSTPFARAMTAASPALMCAPCRLTSTHSYWRSATHASSAAPASSSRAPHDAPPTGAAAEAPAAAAVSSGNAAAHAAAAFDASGHSGGCLLPRSAAKCGAPVVGSTPSSTTCATSCWAASGALAPPPPAASRRARAPARYCAASRAGWMKAGCHFTSGRCQVV
mmetsp:Transcript_20843/g.62712  ORF Transcript_20843/g.62712 Transcript_20843/m.62712 type:complete len:211 (-) Transcript_20843:809-1441(-)